MEPLVTPYGTHQGDTPEAWGPRGWLCHRTPSPSPQGAEQAAPAGTVPTWGWSQPCGKEIQSRRLGAGTPPSAKAVTPWEDRTGRSDSSSATTTSPPIAELSHPQHSAGASSQKPCLEKGMRPEGAGRGKKSRLHTLAPSCDGFPQPRQQL